jgi:hypothetical protein
MVMMRIASAIAAVALVQGEVLGADDEGPDVGRVAALAELFSAAAHHGPGTSGGGSSTISGETLRAGSFDFDLRADFTEFKHFDRAEAEAHAASAGEFDAVKRSLVTTISGAYGLSDDVQVGASIGYYGASDFINAARNAETNSVESGKADPRGLTDLWLNAKIRLMKGKPGNLAAVFGVKLPVGDNNERLDNGELLEPSSQPGSGAFDFQAGLGYSRFLTSRITMDVSGVYTFRTRHDGFKVGDRFDTGLALAYRLTEDIGAFPQWSVFAELNGVWVAKDNSLDEGSNPNTGGTTLFLTPGARVRFSQRLALTVAPSVPIAQDLNGDQDKTRFKLATTLSLSF